MENPGEQLEQQNEGRTFIGQFIPACPECRITIEAAGEYRTIELSSTSANMINRRILKDFDLGFLVVIVLVSLTGVMTIYSSTRPLLETHQELFYLKQLNWTALSLACFFVLLIIDYRWPVRYANILYIAGIFLLILVLVAGKKGMGAQRWLNLGFMSFQPSEFFKIFFVIAISRYFSGLDRERKLGINELAKIVSLFFILPAILILKQPDLGTMLILMFIFIAMILTVGVEKRSS